MRCCKRLLEALLALLLAGWLTAAGAAEIEVRDPQLSFADDGQILLDADFSFDFNARLEEAVGKGLALYFVAEFELSRPRWYWIDDKVVKTSRTWRLTYHALTRQYRLSTGGLSQSFTNLDGALRMLSHLRNWPVFERDQLKAGDAFDAALRLRLDLSQLPKPFQIEALSNKDWILASDWKRWVFTVPAQPVAGSEAK